MSPSPDTNRPSGNTEPESALFTFRILRFDPQKDQEPYFQRYEVEAPMGMTALEALFKIQDEQDGSLCFRYSCRGAVCGSCGMVINGEIDLACRTQIFKLDTREIVVEPLPNMEIQRDLVVDMDPFWKAYEAMEPWLQPEGQPPEKERPQSEQDRARVDQYVNCILCACCYGACPMVRKHPEYMGPAALAKMYRFLADSRDDRAGRVLRRLDSSGAAWGCRTIFRCQTACPKSVRPADGIEGTRRKITTYRLASLVGKGNEGPDPRGEMEP
jgi:succinate dehydrogenase / fumarate reductase iron-sulfur subunit